MTWEPGQTVICALCGRERGGEDPPGDWQRKYDADLRRRRILGPGNAILGYFEWVHP